jgi:hypothetical protein
MVTALPMAARRPVRGRQYVAAFPETDGWLHVWAATPFHKLRFVLVASPPFVERAGKQSRSYPRPPGPWASIVNGPAASVTRQTANPRPIWTGQDKTLGVSKKRPPPVIARTPHPPRALLAVEHRCVPRVNWRRTR